MKFYFLSLLLVFTANLQGQPSDSLRFPQERHLKHVRQLTFGGEADLPICLLPTG
jgi:hypothetical protein